MDCRTERKLSLLKETNFWLQFSVSPRPLGFGFGTKRFGAKGLGPGLDNLKKCKFCRQDPLF